MTPDRPNLTRLKSQLVPILLIIIAVILSVQALRMTRPVTMPIAFAFFIAVVAHPLQARLERYVPKWLAMVGVLGVLAAVVGLFVGAIELSLELIAPKLPQYGNRLQSLAQSAQTWLGNHGLPTGGIPSDGTISQLTQRAVGGAQSVLGAFSLLVLAASFLALLLLEVGKYRDRTQRAFPNGTGDHIIHAVASMGQKLRRYFLVLAFTSFITGVLTSVWCLVLGVELALVWGLLTFVLNFIPTLGSIIAASVPALAATLFQGPATGAATLAGLAAIETIVGNFVDPKLEGKFLKISPFVALLSVVFWGWVWGIPGAFIGVPMTVAVMLFANEFKSSRPIAIMLGGSD